MGSHRAESDSANPRAFAVATERFRNYLHCDSSNISYVISDSGSEISEDSVQFPLATWQRSPECIVFGRVLLGWMMLTTVHSV
jgi:hypothetical protein